jgi:hypothetical protein
MNQEEISEEKKTEVNQRIVTDHVRLKGSSSKRGQYIETALYEKLVERIVKRITTGRNCMATSDELLQDIIEDPPVAMDLGDLTWLTLQVKNHLVFKKLLTNSMEDFTQQIKLTPEGELFFGLR